MPAIGHNKRGHISDTPFPGNCYSGACAGVSLPLSYGVPGVGTTGGADAVRLDKQSGHSVWLGSDAVASEPHQDLLRDVAKVSRFSSAGRPRTGKNPSGDELATTCRHVSLASSPAVPFTVTGTGSRPWVARTMVDLDVRADGVVLSGFETGRGDGGSREGLIFMSWAPFIEAAHDARLRASQWKVESDSTGER